MAGTLLNDRKLAAEVRRMGLDKVKKIFLLPVVEMSDREKDLHDQLLLRVAPALIPRLTEITGEEGGPIQFKQVTGMEIKPDAAIQTAIQNTEPETNTGSPVLD